MQSAAVLSTPDPLSERFVRAARTASAIFLIPKSVSRSRLADFYLHNLGQLRHFGSEKALAAESRRLREVAGGRLYQRAVDAIGKIFGGIALGPPEFPIELTLATNSTRFGIRDDSIGQIVRIDENELTATTLAKFLDAYSPLPSDQRPLFIIETHDAASDVERRLRQLPDDMEVLRFGDHGRLREVIVDRLPSQSLSELIDQYRENAFSPVARLGLPALEQQTSSDEPLSIRIAAKLLHLRAVASERGKFETLPAARSLARLLESERQVLDTSEAEILLAAKVFTNLWLLYCREGERTLFDNSMAIASGLGDELIQAHCLRLINAVHPHSPFTDQCLRQAAKTFFDRGLYDHANYCMNNALVGRFYTMDPCAREFADIIEASAENLDGFRGLAIMMNNAGMASMIEGDTLSAISWFERAANQPSLSLHRFGIQVNAMFARYLEGENPEPGTILKTARAVVRQIDSRYRHHIAHLLLNLYLLAKPAPDCAQEILDLLVDLDLLTDPVVLNDRTTLARLMARLGLADAPTAEHPGLRGRFMERHDFVPGFHHIWL